MGETNDGTHDESGPQGTAASRLLSMTNIWSDAPAPPPAPAPVAVPPPAPSLAPVAPVPVAIEVRPVAAPAASVQARPAPWPPRRLSLALQGGGTFAAFTWGVLERLLEEPIEIDTVSGASAGAINALLLASGFAEGGREAARLRLNRFWLRLMHDASFRSLMLLGGFSPAGSSVAFGPTLRSGQFDPFDLDPLRLVTGGAQMEKRAEEIIAAFENRPHIFNLGHGIVPETPIENVELLVATVKGV